MLFLEWSSLKKTGTGRAKNVRKNGVCKKVLTFFFLIAICWSSFVSCCVHLEEQSLWHCLTYSWNKPKFNFILCDFLKNLCGCCVRSYFPWVGKQKAVWHFGCGRHWVKSGDITHTCAAAASAGLACWRTPHQQTSSSFSGESVGMHLGQIPSTINN